MDQDPRKIVNCLDCKAPTNPKESGVLLECYGFTEYRGATGGANNLKFKKYTGNVICAPCGVARNSGTKGMDSLF